MQNKLNQVLSFLNELKDICGQISKDFKWCL